MAGSDVDKYFSLVALFILFRETVEASIIVSVLLQFLSRSFPHLRKQVWWGVGMGIFVSIIFGVIFSVVFYIAKENVFKGNDKDIFKGCIAWFAAVLIAILAFAMLRYKGWEDKIQRKLQTLAQKELEKANQGDVEDPVPKTWYGRAAHKTRKGCNKVWAPCWRGTTTAFDKCNNGTGRFFNCCWGGVEDLVTCRLLPCKRWRPAPRPEAPRSELVGDKPEVAVSGTHGWGIFVLVFVTVLREGIESVIFLAGVGNAEPTSLPLPGLVGFVCGVALGFFLYYTGKQVKDIKWFIIIMSLVLFFIAGGQIMLGVKFLTNGGMFGYASVWLNERPWYMQPAWDISSCCAIDDRESQKFWIIAQAIVGYQDKPTYLQIIFYFGYWFICIVAAVYKWYNGSLFDADYKHKKLMAKQAKEEAAERARMELAMAEQLQLVGVEDAEGLKKKSLVEASQDLDSQTTSSNDGQGSPTVEAAGKDLASCSEAGEACEENEEPKPAEAQPLVPQQPLEMQAPEIQTAKQ